MIALVQRVNYANLLIDDLLFSQIDAGILVLLGVEKKDCESNAEKLLQKILNYRIFNDQDDKMNLSVKDIDGGLMLVSQFTLAAETRKGLRPSFSSAMAPSEAERIYDFMVSKARQSYKKIAFGKFGSNMRIVLENNGPVTFYLSV